MTLLTKLLLGIIGTFLVALLVAVAIFFIGDICDKIMQVDEERDDYHEQE